MLLSLVEKHGEKAAQVIGELLDDESSKVRLAAANSVLDRILGRPGVAQGHSEETINTILAALLGRSKVQ